MDENYMVLARLTNNQNGWRRPSGRPHKSGNAGGNAFEAIYGFGFEEWLFCPEHNVDGWQYGYVQSIGPNHRNYPLYLYTFKFQANGNGPTERLAIAVINKWEHISDWTDADIAMMSNWSEGMERDVRSVLANDAALEQGITQINQHAEGNPNTLKNIRFEMENVYHFDQNLDVREIITHNHFWPTLKSCSEIPDNLLPTV